MLRKDEEKRMYKSTKLLKVLAGFLILSGVVGGVTAIATPAIMEWSEAVSGMDLGMEFTMLDMVLSVIMSIVYVVIGVLTLMSKQYKTVVILMLVYVVYIIYNTISTTMMMGFSPAYVTSFVIPALYFWGLHTSKIDEVEENVEEIE